MNGYGVVCDPRSGNSGNAGSSGTGSYVISESVGTSPHKRRAAHTALGIWRTVPPSLSRFPLLTSIRLVFLGCSMPMRNPLNRRTRTRIYGGVAGADGLPSPYADFALTK